MAECPLGNEEQPAAANSPHPDDEVVHEEIASSSSQAPINLHRCTMFLGQYTSNISVNYERSSTTATPRVPSAETPHDYKRDYGRAVKETKFDYRALLQDSGVLSCGEGLFNESAMGNTTRVQEFIARDPESVMYQNKRGNTPLHAAAFGGHMDTVITLVSNKAQLEKKNKDGYTALVSAIFGDEPNVVKYLLESGSKSNTASKRGLTPLHVAAREGHERCVKELLSVPTPSDVNCKDGRGYTPLFIAIKKHYMPTIRLLVEHQGINLGLKDARQRNSLHIAAICGNNFAVEQILKAKPTLINVQGNDGFTALHLAASKGHLDITRTLLQQQICSTYLKSTKGHTALHLAVIEKRYECAKALVDNGADVNAQDEGGNTCLHLAMMKVLTASEAMLESSMKDKDKTAKECDDIQQKMFQLLVQHPSVDMTLKNSKDLNCLHFAAGSGNTFATDQILEVKPSLINTTQNDGCTALHLAVLEGHAHIVSTLVKQKNCSKDVKNTKGHTALHLAIIEKHYECAKALVDNGADVNAQDDNGNTCLHLAMMKVLTSIEAMLDAALKDKDKTAILCDDIQQEMFQLLVQHQSVDMTLKNNKDLNCLHFAAGSGNTFATDKIVEAKPSLINTTQNDGCTALHLAVLEGHAHIVSTLVKQKNCSKDVKNTKGHTALHLAIIKKHYECAKVLVDNGADVNAQDDEGNTCLHLVMMKVLTSIEAMLDAALKDKDETAKLWDDFQQEAFQLLVQHPSVDMTLKNNKDLNCLHLAAGSGNKFATDKILEFKPSLINTTQNDGCTALHLAVLEGHAHIVSTLAKQEHCLKDLKNAKGHTALHLAVIKRHYECAKALVDNGVDVNSTDDDGNTCLHLVMRKVLTSIEEMLDATNKDKEECSKDLKNVDGQTALHLATSKKNYACVKALVDSGADVNAQDKDGETSLHLAMKTEMSEQAASKEVPVAKLTEKDVKETSGTNNTEYEQKILETLIQQTNLRLLNNKDYNCLHYAALKGKRFVVEKILEANPSLINTTGNDSNTTLHMAASNGFADILTTLLQKENCQKDIRNASKQTALHLAVNECNLKCIEVLLEYGADVNAKDIHDSTSLHLAIAKISMKNISALSSTKDDGDMDHQVFATIKEYQKVIKLLVEHPTIDLTLTDKTGFNCLHSAAINGNSFAVKIMLAAKPSLIDTTCTADKGTALHLAVLNNHTDIVATLCEKGRNETIPNVNAQTPLHLAADNCNTKSVEILLNMGANVNAQDKDGDTCLHLLLKKSLQEATSSTVKKQKGVPKSSLEIQNLIRMLLRDDRIDVTLRDNNRDNCLHFAAFSGNDDAVKLILKAMPSVINERNETFTPLHIASLYDHADVVQTLAKQGNCNKDLQNCNSQTALHIAIDKNHYQCIEALVNNGANVNIKDSGGNTSLHLVMMKESTQAMLRSASKEELLDIVKKKEEDGSVRNGRTNLVALITSLLKHGANIHLLNNKGENVAHFAPNSSVQSFLEELFERFTSIPKQPGT
ncbi:serine/threonine-protein phosphatase 6 regulatory ankyrin repeat subunit B-like isoform X2 [Acanthaster planci]|uniref:Serine/threonine-protein phosphatase 6 regulatory ankyrin repeat subunit B-like isoform X2 n=1 Tax=Acanthaster planci TaxID=133434 RepID=A0A8B8A282_ACAPL|nr:serine/threonine-protein phosphatase 6 regulatory ankyrin repeat subunit B-like isoform X2 [Acanthaster planci]